MTTRLTTREAAAILGVGDRRARTLMASRGLRPELVAHCHTWDAREVRALAAKPRRCGRPSGGP